MSKEPPRKGKRPTPSLTKRGGFVLLAILFGIFCGVVISDATLIHLSLFSLLIFALARVAAGFNLRKLYLERTTPASSFALRDFPVTVRLLNRKRWLHSFAVQLEDTLIPFVARGISARRLNAGEGREIRSVSRLVKRGRYADKGYIIQSTFPLGLFLTRMKRKGPLDILIFPKPVLPRVLRQQVETTQLEGENEQWTALDYTGDFRGIREYQHGDLKKSIHWPATSRIGKLMVRERDRPTPEKLAIFFHSFVPEGESTLAAGFDHSMELLCGLLQHCRQLHIPLSLTASFNDWRPLEIEDPENLTEALVVLATAQQQIDDSMDPLAQALGKVPGHYHIYVLSDTPVSHWQNLLPPLPHPITCLDNKEMRVRDPRMRFARSISLST